MAEESNTLKLYNSLRDNGYKLPEYDRFEGRLKDSAARETLYNTLRDNGVNDLPEFSAFETWLGYPMPEDLKENSSQNPAKQQTGFLSTFAGDMLETLDAGASDLFSRTFGAIDKGAKLLEDVSGGYIKFPDWAKQASDYFKNSANISRAKANRYDGKSWGQLWDEGDKLGAIGDIALKGFESLPTSIAAAISSATNPYAGLALISAGSASEKYDQLSKENPDMNEFAQRANATISGLAEGASELLGAGVSNLWMNSLYKIFGKERAEQAVKQGFLGVLKKHFKDFGIFYEPVVEGLEEVSSQLAQNITDKITGAAPDKDISEGLMDSFIYGMGGGAYFSAAGVPGFIKQRVERRKALQAGKEMPETEYNSAYQSSEQSRQFLSDIDPNLATTIDRYVNDDSSAGEMQSFFDGLDETARPLAEAYYRTQLVMRGITERNLDDAEAEVQAFADRIAPFAVRQDDGHRLITTAHFSEGLTEKDVYVSAINGDKAVIFTDDGSTSMVSVKRLQNIQEQDADDLIARYRENALDGKNTQMEFRLHHHPKTQPAQPGLVIFNGDKAYILQERDERGDWVAFPAVLDTETGQTTAKKGGEPSILTDAEVLELQDLMYAAQEPGNQANEEAEKTSGVLSETPNVSDETLGENPAGSVSPEERLNALAESLPKTKDGAIDYKRLTPQQQYEYTSLTDSPEVALEDIRRNIVAGNREIDALDRQLEKATGGKLTEIRDKMRAKREEVKGLKELYREVAPADAQDIDENGYPFMLSSDGTDVFGQITAETGLKEAPIKLSEGFNRKDNAGRNHGYGLAHIEESHGEQIRNAGFPSVNAFVESVAKNYETIRKGNNRNGNKTYLLEASDGKNNTLFVELSQDGSYWTVNSAGIFRSNYSKNKEIVWPLPAVEVSSTAEGTEVRNDNNRSNSMSGDSSQTISQDKGTVSSSENQAISEENARPSADDMLDTLLDGSLSIEEVDVFVDANRKDVGKRLADIDKKKPVPGTNLDEYKRKRSEWQARRDAVQQEADYWEDINNRLRDSRRQPGDDAALNVLKNQTPQTGEELAAEMLADGSIKLLRDDFQRETGGGRGETRGLFGLFAGRDKGGMTIEQAGEVLMQADLEQGTNFFDQSDPNAGRNAIIEVLSGARTRGDLINYVRRSREEQARRAAEAEYNEYAEWCEANFRMSPEDYEAYVEAMERDFRTKMQTPEAFDQVSGEIYEEMLAQQQEYADIDAALAQSNTTDNENIERNDEGGGNSLREGSDEILPETQPRETGRTGETEGERETGADARGEDGAAQESAGGRIEPVGNGPFGFIYNQFKGKVREAIDFLIKHQSGDLLGVFHRDDVGDIDLVWGDKNGGLAHIIDKHINTHDDFKDINEASRIIEDVINNGEIAKNGQLRIEITDGKYKVSIRKDYNGKRKNWVVTALDSSRGEKEKRIPAIKTSSTDNNQEGVPNALGISSEDKGSNTSSENQTSAPEFIPGESEFDYAQRVVEANKRKAEERKVDTNPTEAQKEAGNYKKGHIKLDGFDITIENPKGSTRSGVDANGNPWSITMNNTYGYIRGTEGVDGDHIDVFLSDDPTQGDVFVIDQVKADGTFDEHKVMYGFPSEKAAREAYLANYSPGWQGLGNITQVSKEEFKKWVDSSKRKTKPFADYKNIRFRMAKTTQEENDIITQAKIDGTYLKAPNGENTNLSESQWIQVRTKAFKDWFGDWENNPMEASKIVDKNGEPMVVYHGSLHNFDVFGESIKRKTNVDAPDGVYFMTTNRNVASSYAGTDENVVLDENKKIKSVFTGEYLGGIYPLFANVRRPLVLDYKGMPWRTSFDDDINKKVLEARESEFDGVIAKNIMDLGPFGNSASNRNTTANDIVVFSPNQMKSATDNTGTYSTKDNNIRFRFIGERGAANLDRAEEATTRMDNLSVARDMENAFNEKQARIEKLRESKPVEITGEEHKGKYELKRDSAKAWIKDNLRGEYTINDTNETVAIGRKGINKVTSHSMGNEAHLKSLIAVPDIIQNAIFITEEVAEKKNAQYPKYRYYVVGLKIGGEDYTVKVTIGVDENGNKYYDHALTEIEKGTLIDNLNGTNPVADNQNANGFISTGAEPDPSVTGSKDTKLRTILQTSPQENARKIKMATGWERGADGKWRYETPDIELTLPENIEEDKDYKLTDFVKDDELFKAYPHMKDYKVRFENQPDEYGSGGYGSKMIVINTAHSYPEHYESIFVHEIQHGIQAHEGFESGDNPDEVIDRYLDAQSDIETADVGTLNAAAFIRKKAERLVKKGQYKYMRWAVRSAMGTMKGRNRMYEAYGPIETLALYHTSKELHEAYEKAFNEGGSLLNSGLPTVKEAERLYMRNAGEVEARNVQTRMNMPEELRRSSLASDTEDISREDQLFIDNALNNSYERRTGNTAPQIPRSEANRANPGIGPLEYPNDDLGRPEHAQPRGGQDARGREADGRPQPGSGRNDSQNGTDNGRGNTDARREDRRAGGRNHAAAGRAGEQPRREDRRGGQRGVVGNIEPQGDHRGAGGDNRQSGADDRGLGGAARQRRERYRRAAVETARRLGVRIRIVDSETPNVSDKTWDKISGMYDISSGEVYINLSNIRSEADAVRTVLHEVVGHKGLRELIGNEEVYNAEMMRLYGLLPLEARREVSRRAMERYDGDFAVAMDEYLAEQAERDETPSWWQRVVSAVRDMLRRLGVDVELSDNDVKYLLWRSRKRLEARNGFEVAEDVVMRRRLGLIPDRGRNVRFREAKEEVEESTPSGEPMVRAWDRVMASDFFKMKETLFDYLQSVKEFQKLLARYAKSKILDYENAYQSLLTLSSRNRDEMDLFESKYVKKLNEAIVGLTGKVRGKWDWSKGVLRDLVVYVEAKHGIERNRDLAVRKGIESLKGESFTRLYQTGVVTKEEVKVFRAKAEEEAKKKADEKYKETLERVFKRESAKEGVSETVAEDRAKEAAKRRREAVETSTYENAVRDFKAKCVNTLYDRWENAKHEIFKMEGLSWEEKQVRLDEAARAFQWKDDGGSFGAVFGKDYSGLSSVFKSEDGEKADWNKMAHDYVKAYEGSHDAAAIDNLWGNIRNVASYSLLKQNATGLVDKKYVETNLNRFEYFVPLRGFDDDTAGDVYNYIYSDEIKGGNPVKSMEGRSSEAANPFGGLLSVAYTSITAGNKNISKQKFLNLVRNHDTQGMATLDNIWIRNQGTAENPEWVEAIPEIPTDATPEKVTEILNAFEEQMQDLADEGKAQRTKGGKSDIPYRTMHSQRSEHQVQVMVGGNRYIITINGNPRVAQAINGLLNPDVDTRGVYEWGRKVQHFMSGAFTSYNPAFSLANLSRDTGYANNMVFINENFKYWKKFTKNQRLGFGRLPQMARFLRAYREGKIDDIKGDDARYFKEFMSNGGATGYTFIESQKEYAEKLAKQLGELSKGDLSNMSPRKWLKLVFDSFEFMGNAAELVNRFAAYKTSREDGRSVSRSISDAKEITLNFNRKGAGIKTYDAKNKWYINALASISQFGRSYILFWNANLQGKLRFFKSAMAHPVKALPSFIGGAAAMGAMLPFLNNMFLPMLYEFCASVLRELGIGDDDDEKYDYSKEDYYDVLSDYDRERNICLRLPGGYWAKIPVSPDMAIYMGAADKVMGSILGKRDLEIMDGVEAISDVASPVSINWNYEGAALALNAFPTVVQPVLQNMMNVNFMGNPIRKESINRAREADPEYTKVYRSASSSLVALSKLSNDLTGGDAVKAGAIDWNPALMQNFINGYTGGFGTVAIGVADMIVDSFNGEKVGVTATRFPLVGRFLTGGDVEVKKRRVNANYQRKVVDFVNKMEHDYKGYERQIQDPKTNDFDRAEYILKSNELQSSKDFQKAYELKSYIEAISDFEKWLKEFGDNEDMENQLYELKLRALEIVGEKNDRNEVVK